ncbi:TolC family protein [Desulfoprunum benzoelyticum]|uniref:Outer membrane protein TolC n=1 Tax=Desulfoprunum benzoelyticum TaxID=1506996 RepID=A0A840V545_9BACT|nr:TolC family protein [Desulfoprunum benzoelyticum]MBB5348201.1 outer membrane protein TolC [Desulfoprunum benzoelyticum]MBM9530871.1 TolC family protein [Desulfoprunum benzoelyticum]
MTRFAALLCFLLLLVAPGLAAAGQEPLLTLDEAIAIALRHSPLIREAEAIRDGAREEIKATRADFLPKASAQYGYARLKDEPFQRIGGTPIVVGNDDVHRWDLSLSQPLFTGFAVTSRHEMAKIGAEIRELERQQQIVTVSQDLRIAWFEALLAARLNLVAEDNVTALTAHRHDAAGFLAQGLNSRNDLLKAEASLANAIQERERARAASEIARSRLSWIMGYEIEPGRTLEDFTALTIRPLELQALYDEARRHSPVLQSYRLGLDNLDHAITLAQSGYYPTIAVTGRYEQNGSDPGAETNDYGNDHNASITLTARWDFFEWGRTGAVVAKQRYSRQALTERQREVDDQIRLAVKQAWLELQVAENSIAAAAEGRKQARENWRITNLQYQNQVITSTEVLDSRTLLSQAESNYFRALYGYRIAMAGLERALGRK